MNEENLDNRTLIDLYIEKDCLTDKIMLLSMELDKIKERIQLKQQQFNSVASDV